jgi:signal transduction histidine kinase
MDTNEQLIQAVHLATRKLASTGDFDTLLREVLGIAVEAVGATGGTIYVHDPIKKVLRFHHVIPEDVANRLPYLEMPDDAGVAGQVFQTRKTQVSQFSESVEQRRREIENATGVVTQTMVTAPLMLEDEEPIGVVQLINKRNGPFSESDVAVLDTVAAVSTMAYMNSKLIEESSRASTLLGMGKVSHDIFHLAASLLANISVSELTLENIRQSLKQNTPDKTAAQRSIASLEEICCDLKATIQRIVGYSQLISDLSSGRELRPNKVVCPISDTIRSSAEYAESLARKYHVRIVYKISEDAPPLLHDPLYLYRIVQNLVGNAVRAVVEVIPQDWEDAHADDEDAVFGDVVVGYHFENGLHVIEVKDCGPGMTRETAERILAGTARSQWDKGTGSGWGTKIVLELTAMHDGKVFIESDLGSGSLFRVTIPDQRG